MSWNDRVASLDSWEFGSLMAVFSEGFREEGFVNLDVEVILFLNLRVKLVS